MKKFCLTLFIVLTLALLTSCGAAPAAAPATLEPAPEATEPATEQPAATDPAPKSKLQPEPQGNDNEALAQTAREYLDALGCEPLAEGENKAEMHIVSITKDDGDYKIHWDWGSGASGNETFAFSKMHFFDPADLNSHYQPFTMENGQMNYQYKDGDSITVKEFRVNFEPECQVLYMYFEGILESMGAPPEIQTPPLLFTFLLGNEPELLEETPRNAEGVFDNYIPLETTY